MGNVKKVFAAVSILAALVLLGGCAPVPPGPGAPIPPGLALSCLLPLAILLVIALMAALVVYIARNRPGSAVQPATKSQTGGGTLDLPAEEIARRRYASGEITYDELQQILRNLRDAGKGESS